VDSARGTPVDKSRVEVYLAGVGQVGQAEVQRLADDYRAAMAAGDQRFATDPFQKLVLNAIVAESASSTKDWIESRVPNGSEVAEPLAPLVTVVTKTDRFGRAITATQNAALKQAQKLAAGLIAKGTAPLWLGAIGAAFVGAFAKAQEVGFQAGVALAALLLAGGGRFAYLVTRAAPAVVANAQAASQGLVRTFDQAGRMGSPSQTVLEEAVGQDLDTVYGTLNSRPPQSNVLRKIRGFSQTVLGLLFAISAVLAAYGIWGVAQGFSAGTTHASWTVGNCVSNGVPVPCSLPHDGRIASSTFTPGSCTSGTEHKVGILYFCVVSDG
jgi:hypothetical protein